MKSARGPSAAQTCVVRYRYRHTEHWRAAAAKTKTEVEVTDVVKTSKKIEDDEEKKKNKKKNKKKQQREEVVVQEEEDRSALRDACCAARELLLTEDGPLAGGISEARVYVSRDNDESASTSDGDEFLTLVRMAGPAHEAEGANETLRLGARAIDIVLSAFANGADASFPALPDERRALVMPFTRRDTLLGVFVLDWAPGAAPLPTKSQRNYLRRVARLVAAAAAADMLREEERGAEKERLGELVEELGAPLAALRTLASMLVTQLQPEEPKADLVRGMLDVSARLRQLNSQLQGAVAPRGSDQQQLQQQLPGLLGGAESDDDDKKKKKKDRTTAREGDAGNRERGEPRDKD